MPFEAISSRLTGTPSEWVWTQTHEFRPSDEPKFRKRGRLFAIISLRRPAGSRKEGIIDNVDLGREVLLRLNEEYFGDLSKEGLEGLKNAVSRVWNEFNKEGVDLEIIAASIVGRAIYSALAGGGGFWVFRNSRVARILENGEGIVAASGYPKHGDTLVLGTRSFFRLFSEGVIREALIERDIQRAIEFFAPKVHSQGLADVGLVLIRLTDPEVGDIGMAERVLEKRNGVPVNYLQRKIGEKSEVKKKALSVLSRFGFERKLYVRGFGETSERGRRGRVSAFVGVILIVLLLLSIFFGIRRKKEKERLEVYNSEIAKAEHLLDEAVRLYSLNPSQAREIFTEAKTIIYKLQEEGINDPKIDSLKKFFLERQETLLAEYQVKAEEFLDLTLISSGFKGKKIAWYSDHLYILDERGERIVSVEVGSKRSSIAAGPSQIRNAQNFAVYADKIFFINDDGLFEIEGKKISQISEKDWFGQPLIEVYAGNIYLLERDSSAIWRYTGGEAGFAAKKNWLAEGQGLDLTESVDWGIDGSIWVVKDGLILKFSLGSSQDYAIKGVTPPIEKIDAIFVGEDADGVYILENSKKRVVLVSKGGEYKAQYYLEGLDSAFDLVVFGKEKKMILLGGEKLYSVELKHLM